ncbi:MAG: hypothetical protein JNL64_04675 [Blastocatellia bacterium]|nr:hypothetical protein [Blastocatellia bacterium]
MFEQSLYEQPHNETPEIEQPVPEATPVSEEGGLFSSYEIKSWTLDPRIYKILGVSAVFNLLAVAIFTQGSLMTMKGCDSPLVGSVCKVLDTVYVGSVLFGTERNVIDADYEKTELSNATMVFTELPPETEKISYPEGYFALANPIEWQAKIDAMNALNGLTETVEPGFIAPGIPNNNSTIGIPTTPAYKPGRSILDTPAKQPNPNKGKIDPSKLPTGIDDVNDDVAVKQPNGKPNANGVRPDGIDPASNANASKPKRPPFDPNSIPQEESKPDQFGIVLNKRPLKVFAGENMPQIETLSPKDVFNVTVTAEIAPKTLDGKETGIIGLQNVQRTGSVSNNKRREEIAQLAIEGLLAVGDSGWMGYLHKLGVKNVIINIDQNPNEFRVSIKSDQPNEAEAARIVNGLSGWISLGKNTATGDSKVFLENAKLTTQGKAFLLNLTFPTAEVHAMIKRAIEGTDKQDGNAGQKISTAPNLGE